MTEERDLGLAKIGKLDAKLAKKSDNNEALNLHILQVQKEYDDYKKRAEDTITRNKARIFD